PQLIKLARETGIPMAATNDSHYLRKEDAKMQAILLCIQTGKTMQDADRMEFQTDEFYVKTTDEMYDLFAMVPDACANTQIIADQCNFDFEFGNTKIPYYKAPGGMDNQAFFEKLCWEGLERRYGSNVPQANKDRLNYEISVIKTMGYTNYYLIVWDYVNYAKSQGIPVGPGRGSGAGSIAAYSVGITDIDPIRYNLIFERFLNPERVSMPDFDVDFCYERRQEVIDYVNRKYGADHVAQIVTFGTMAARNAIRDVGRVMGMPYQEVDVVAKQVPAELKMTIKHALEVSPELRRMYETDPKVTELLDTAMKVEGMPRHASTHAAGVVITPEPTDYYLPLATNDGLPVTQFNMTEIEELGLLKMDFLGLRTLTVIRDAELAIRKKEPDFSIAKLDYDDPETYKMLSRGETEGVFQLESSGMKQVLVGLQPQNLEDVIALISLYRPGPMDSIPTYLRNRHEPDKISYKTPQLAHILDVTNGCIVYQEQVMQIFRELAGFSFGQADNVRRAMSKKKHAVMEAEREHFVHGCTDPGNECPGCVANGISEKVANEIYDEMSSFASYAFNKSHAACYAYVAFQTAYLKCHYPSEFMAALLTSVLDNTGKVIEYSGECARLGIKVLPPDINISGSGFTAEDSGRIRFGLNAVKNVGTRLIERSVEERQEKPYTSLYDFCKRMHGTELNRRTVESLIKAGAFDNLGSNRRSLVEATEGVLKSIESDSRKNLDGQIDLFSMMSGMDDAPAADSYEIKPCPEYTHAELLQQEKEVSGLYLSGHPLDAYREQSAQFATHTINALTGEDAHVPDNSHVRIVCTIVKSKMVTTKTNSMMAYTSVEDLTGTMEVIVFPRTLETFRDVLHDNAVVVIEGRLSIREDEPARLVAESISPIEGYNPVRPQANRPNQMRDAARRLYVRLPSRTSPEYAKVVNLLEIFDGDMPVIFYLEDTKQKLAAPRRLYTSGHPLFFEELQRIVGEKNVATK
ncbi:MAG: DNA polymerase III subunit alpha, partial [Faecalibacterium prausnitzii]|nr:DNA polymerase III subunit alpha [Faecalibacterium prausnitzii]